ncbi:MAG: DNRLRE domain-containing protein [Chloroflexi bacterium]|nr:DNRLRE domain-containing protein [Chloroflexota bacterium]
MKKKLQSYFMLFILALSLTPAFIPTPVYAQEFTEVVLQPDGNSGYDTYISSVNTSTNYGTAQTMLVGETSADEIGRGIITFDTSAIPADAAVETATLSLWVESDQATNASTLQLYALIPPWVESEAHWTRYRISPINGLPDNWQTAGASGAGDIDGVAGTYSLAADLTQGAQIDITLDPEIVGHIIRENYYGFLLKTETEANDAYAFYTSDATDETKRPKLTVSYNPEPIIEDVGWYCVDGDIECETWYNNYDVYSPFYHSEPEANVAAVYGGAWDFEGNYNKLGAKIACEPYPRCRNDYPIYYTVTFTYEWTSQTQNDIYAVTTLKATGEGSDITIDKVAMRCNPVGTWNSQGTCKGIISGVILPEEMPDVGNGVWDIYLKTSISFYTGYPVSAGVVWGFKLSRQMPAPECADTYVVPEIDNYVIDPTLETPVGMANGDPVTDENAYQLEQGQMYMLRVQDGPWWEGESQNPRYDTEVSFDGGTTYLTFQELVVGNPDILCYDFDPTNPWWITAYFTATTDTIHIRVNDRPLGETPSRFANNTNDPVTPISYSIGIAYLTDAGCPEFTYSAEDILFTIDVPSEEEDVPVYDAGTPEIVGGDWYGIKVNEGTWNEDTPTTPRIDMEFGFIVFGPQPEPPPWADLAEGSALVSCVSLDGSMVFVQAPSNQGLVLHLRVNDQDDPQNWADNSGLLNVSLYHVTNTYIPSGCAEPFTVDDIVASGDTFGDQVNGEGFGNSFDSLDGFGNTIPGGVSTSYYMTPGGWYMLETRDGPWTASSSSGSSYTTGVDYYDIQLRRLSTDFEETWSDPESWTVASCVVPTDMLGHVRVYFQVPSNAVGDDEGGVEFMIRVAGASNSTTGEIGWDLYQAVNTEEDVDNPWETCLDTYGTTTQANQAWIPVKAVEGASVVQNAQIGGGTTLLEPGVTYYLITNNGPWQDGENPDDRYKAELSSDGGVTWFPMSTHPNLSCGEVDQLDQYEKVVFTVATGQAWKIRVADTETEIFTDNTGSLAYQLWRAVIDDDNPNPPPIDYYSDIDFDACQPMLIRPVFTSTSTFPTRSTPSLPSTWDVSDWVTYLGNWFASIGDYIGDLSSYLGDLIDGIGAYISGWAQYVVRTVMTYFAWCPRHTNIIIVEIEKLKQKEPLASIYELNTAEDTTIAEIKSYDWGAGGEGGGIAGEDYEDTSIFSFGGEGGGADDNPETVNRIIEKIFPSSGPSNEVWEDGDLVTFEHGGGTPEYYDTCNSLFSDFLPTRLRMGVCFASSWWKETGAAWWIQLSLDISTVFLLIIMIKGAIQSLVYMMTGVRPWTKDGAIKVIETVARGDDVVRPVDEWRYRR